MALNIDTLVTGHRNSKQKTVFSFALRRVITTSTPWCVYYPKLYFLKFRYEYTISLFSLFIWTMLKCYTETLILFPLFHKISISSLADSLGLLPFLFPMDSIHLFAHSIFPTYTNIKISSSLHIWNSSVNGILSNEVIFRIIKSTCSAISILKTLT